MPAPAVAPDLESDLFLEGDGAAEVEGEVAMLEPSGVLAVAAAGGVLVVWGAGGAAVTTGVIGSTGCAGPSSRAVVM